MEQLTYEVGNPTALLIERIFWLVLGGLLGVTIITSLIRESNRNKNKVSTVSQKELKDIAQKALRKKQ